MYANISHVARTHDCKTREIFMQYLKERDFNLRPNILFSIADKGYNSLKPTDGVVNSLAAYKDDQIKKLGSQFENDVSQNNAKSWNRFVNETRREVECVYGSTYKMFLMLK